MIQLQAKHQKVLLPLIQKILQLKFRPDLFLLLAIVHYLRVLYQALRIQASNLIKELFHLGIGTLYHQLHSPVCRKRKHRFPQQASVHGLRIAMHQIELPPVLLQINQWERSRSHGICQIPISHRQKIAHKDNAQKKGCQNRYGF